MNEITPEKVAAALTGGDDVNEVLNRWVDVNAVPGSSTARITVTPINDAGDQDEENAQHFRAVVVEGEEAPIVLEWPAELGLSWQDGGDLLTLDSSGIIRLNPRGVDEWDLSPEEALELAAQLAAMAALVTRTGEAS